MTITFNSSKTLNEQNDLEFDFALCHHCYSCCPY